MMPPNPSKHAFSRRTHHHTCGFSLVELSIVLVILGLLVGGVLSGQSLIRAAELRAVGTEYQRYVTATQSFRDKYLALPGDMTNATSFWGDQAAGTSACASGSTADGTPGTCNGDGDGYWTAQQAGSGEGLRAWQQLAMAGLIEGSYLGYMDGGTKITVGVNVPESKINNAGWALMQRNGVGNSIYGFYGNMILLGKESTNYLWAAVIKPEELWNIDTKIDDGLPVSGRILGTGNGGCTSPLLSDTVAPTAGVSYAYNITSSSILCRPFFIP